MLICKAEMFNFPFDGPLFSEFSSQQFQYTCLEVSSDSVDHG